MVDLEKRSFMKPWMMHADTKMIKHHFHDTHLPPIKQTGENSVTSKHPLPRQSKRRGSVLFPPLARTTSTGTLLANGAPTSPTNNIESSPIPMVYSSAVHEAAQRFILRSNLIKLSQETTTAHVTHSFHPRRSTLYNHIQAKIDTGLPRTDSIRQIEPETHQLEPIRPVNWSSLKHEIEQDTFIRAHSKRIQFDSGITYATQLTTLGNLIRSKVKNYLVSATGSGDERYKIIVHLTVFPTTAAGLHVASRCLWNIDTDNSITIKMQGVDCNILAIIFLCYTDLGAI